MQQWTFKTVKKQPFAEVLQNRQYQKFRNIFIGKHLCWGLFLIKLQAFRPVTFLKRDSNTGVSCEYCKIFKNSFFMEHLRLLLLVLLPWYSKVSKSAWYLISRLHMLSILIKTYTKRYTKNSLLSCDKAISSLLELIDHVLSISEYILGEHYLLWFWWKA